MTNRDPSLPALSRLLLAALLWFAPLLLIAQPISVHYTENPPAIDGDSADWDSPLALRFVQQQPKPYANTTRIHLAWDEDMLYLLAIVDDQLVYCGEDSAQRLHLNDAVELYLDPLKDSGHRMDLNDYQFIVAASGRSAILKGDLARIQDSTQTAPKEFGIATLVFLAAAKAHQAGYVVEMAVPFAGVGLQPKEGTTLRMDFCMNDLDTIVDIRALPDSVEIPHFFYSNWSHERDFSYPDHWRDIRLEGQPSLTTSLGRRYARWWPLILGLLAALSTAIFVWMAFRIRQLRDVPHKGSLPQAFQAEQPAEAQGPSTHPGDAEVPRTEPPTQEPPLVARCRAYLLANLDRDIGPEELASHCAMSLRALQRAFKEQAGISPGNLVAIVKMEEAARMLAAGTHNVNEAAHALGFQDGSYFSRVFRKYHGQPPSSVMPGR